MIALLIIIALSLFLIGFGLGMMLTVGKYEREELKKLDEMAEYYMQEEKTRKGDSA